VIILGDSIKIDLGCGEIKKTGCIGIDCRKTESVDLVLDLSQQQLPFDDKSVEYI
jgi:predicted SAM-dependent methyltransferase